MAASALTTVRLGDVAYSCNGNKLTDADGMRPLFIGRSELGRYDEIQMAGMRKC